MISHDKLNKLTNYSVIRKLPFKIFSLLLLVFAFFYNIKAQEPVSNASDSNPIVLMFLIGFLALAPFLLIMMTSFLKISVVLSLLRNAIGVQQTPPNQAITGISLILTFFVMSPVFTKMYSETSFSKSNQTISKASLENFLEDAQKAKEPLREFLIKFAHEKDRVMFRDLAIQMAQSHGANPEDISENDFQIILPSFITSQLSEAFQIGFYLLIPFLVVDLIVSNILQAMGMIMLSPLTISLPFKILLFVSIDGWSMVAKLLIQSYM